MTRKKASKKKLSRKTSKNQEVIKEYIENLNKQFKEKDLYSFCVFPEQGFKNKIRESI